MNKVMYILGTTSKNYRRGYAKYINNAHFNHVHPFTALPTEHIMRLLRKNFREEDEIMMKEFEEWKDKMQRDKEQAKRLFRSNRVTK